MLVLRVLHVIAAAAWFGHKLLIPSDLRRSLTNAAEAAGLVGRMRRAERLGIASGLATLVTGAALLLAVGPGVVGKQVYLGLGLVLVAIAVGAGVGRPASRRLAAAVDEGSLDSARPAASILVTVLNVEALLWSGALLTMLI